MSEWGIGIGSKTERTINTMIENGKVTSEVNKVVADPPTILERCLGWCIDGSKILASFLVDNYEIFVIAGIVGMYFVIVGKKELGTKITSGSFIAYIVCKAVESIC